MRRLIAAAWMILAAAGASAQTVNRDPDNRSITAAMRALPVHVGGRVRIEPLPAPMPRGALSFVHQWPGIYFEAAFRGSRVLLKFDDSANEYRLLIDDRPPIALPQPGRVEIAVSGLGPGPHRLRLEKLTESITQVAAFQGFYIPAGTPLTVTPRARQIEFIGPSGMTGYGDRSGKRECTKEEVRLTTDTQQAFPALAARHFDADYQINAVSGRGLVRNYDGDPVPPLSVVHGRRMIGAPEPYFDPDWHPQLIFTSMFVDFITPLKPGEPWKNQTELLAAYMPAYMTLIAELHRASPNAVIVVDWPTGPNPDPATAAAIKAQQDQFAAMARQTGAARIEFMTLPDLGFDKLACDSHGSLADNRKVADWLIGYIDRLRVWPER